MKSASTNITRQGSQTSGSILATISSLNYTDLGYLNIEIGENPKDTEMTGYINHLGNYDRYLEGNFSIRFLENDTLVEYINCYAIELEQDQGLRFIVPKGDIRVLKVSKNNENQTQKMIKQIQNLMSSRQYGNIVFVMGAGASIDVLPGGADLLRKMLEADPHTEICRFITDVFKADIKKEEVPFPSFNQVLNVIDIALEREEGFSAEYSLESLRKLKKNMIGELRKYLIDRANPNVDNSYTELAQQLKAFKEKSGKISFITLNYDLYLDEALNKVFGTEFLEYVLPFQSLNDNGKGNDIQNTGEKENLNKIKIIKLHGSLDWLICPTCFNAFRVSENLHKALSRRTCPADHTELKEFLFPPTKERIEVHSHWTSLQGVADQLLRQADKVVFIGFSLSEDDAHFRFKLKKHLHRPENPVYIQVVSREKKEFDIATDAVSWNYWQFFGPIDYRPIGFKLFSKHPY